MAKFTPLGAWRTPLVVQNTSIRLESRLVARIRKEPPQGDPLRSSMLLFVRSKTASEMKQQIQAAFQSATTINRDLMPTHWLPLKGNGDAADLIRDYDILANLAFKLFRSYEIPNFGDIEDPRIHWLATLLRAEFGPGWCGDGKSAATDFMETTKKVIIERMAELSKHWITARVSDARSNSRFA